jgi:hypothetical protein
MKRSLAVALAMALAAAVTVPRTAAAQTPPAAAQASPFPPPPPMTPQGASPFPPPPPVGSQGAAFPAPSSVSQFPQGGPGGLGAQAPRPPQAPQCADFPRLRDEAQKKAGIVEATGKRKGDRKEMCVAITNFFNAEAAVVKFLDTNKAACGVPEQALAQAKTIHGNTMKFRDTVCAEGPKPKAPTLSDAIATPTLDTGSNTRTGRGTLDTLTGNPLAK